MLAGQLLLDLFHHPLLLMMLTFISHAAGAGAGAVSLAATGVSLFAALATWQLLLYLLLQPLLSSPAHPVILLQIHTPYIKTNQQKTDVRIRLKKIYLVFVYIYRAAGAARAAVAGAASGGGHARSKPSTAVSPMRSGGSTVSPMGSGGASGAVLIGRVGTGGAGGSVSSVAGGAAGGAVGVSPHPSAGVLDGVAVLVGVADGVAVLVGLPAVLCHLLSLND